MSCGDFNIIEGDIRILDIDGNPISTTNRFPVDSTLSGNEDPLTGSLVVITHRLHTVHEGKSFIYTGRVSLSMGASHKICITTPDTLTHSHFVSSVRAESEASVFLYENPTSLVKGSSLPVFNRNRNSLNTNTTILNEWVSHSNPGTLIHEEYFEKQPHGSEDTRGGELVLKQDEEYILWIESGVPGNTRCSSLG
jgi:hypothetical protein